MPPTLFSNINALPPQADLPCALFIVSHHAAACRFASRSSRSSVAVKGYSSGNSASVASPGYFAEYEVHGPDFTHLTAILLFIAVK